jgi:hypothetical protein
MTSTALFDGYLPEAEVSRRPHPVQRRTEATALSSRYAAEEYLGTNYHASAPSSSGGRMRLGPEDEQHMPRSPGLHRDLEGMPEEDEQRADDEHTLIGSEHDEPLSRGHRARAGSALPTPTPSFNGSTTPTQSLNSARSGHHRQHHQQSSNPAPAQSQASRKTGSSAQPSARVR